MQSQSQRVTTGYAHTSKWSTQGPFIQSWGVSNYAQVVIKNGCRSLTLVPSHPIFPDRPVQSKLCKTILEKKKKRGRSLARFPCHAMIITTRLSILLLLSMGITTRSLFLSLSTAQYKTRTTKEKSASTRTASCAMLTRWRKELLHAAMVAFSCLWYGSC